MKERIKKAVWALVIIAAFIDWPVRVNAVNGGAVVKSCSPSTRSIEKAVENSSKEAGKLKLNPAAGAYGASQAIKNHETPTPNIKYVTCDYCNGYGYVIVPCNTCDEGAVLCGYCYGDGCEYCNGYGIVRCPTCKGTGETKGRCDVCNGSGQCISNN